MHDFPTMLVAFTNAVLVWSTAASAVAVQDMMLLQEP
jgi:hypothetical protein